MALQLLSSDINRQKRRKLLLRGGAIWFMYIRQADRSTRSIWTKEWLLRRPDLGAYDMLLSELRQEDQVSFLNFLRLSPGIFDQLLEKVTPLIERQDTTFRRCISPGMRLAITLRFLATGETFRSLGFLFRVGNNTIGQIVPETCTAIHDVLQAEYFKCPTTTQEWKNVAQEFMTQWNYPNCIGALDGKHVEIRKPVASGGQFYNYKHCFSVVLLALVDSKYKFLFVDIGAQGRCSDAGVFRECDLNAALQDNTISVPLPESLPGTNVEFPYGIIADDAFPLRENIMKPFSHKNLTQRERIFNYRLSRARRCVENAFGVMSSRFRVLLNPICLCPSKVDKIVIACCTLHNFLRTLVPTKYTARLEDEHSAKNKLPKAKVSSRRSVTKSAKQYRELLCDYFSSPEGSVPWQNSML